MKPTLTSLCVGLSLLLAAACGGDPAPASSAGAPGGGSEVVLRVGHFPNLTHAHGLIAHGLTREGKGWFEQRLGEGVRIEWFVYNAGPSAMEAIFTGTLDLTYVGPNPALNAYVKSKGEEIRVLAGATNGGSGLVVPGDGRLSKPEDFRGKKIATPQLGNTQDVACRAWLVAQGYQVTQSGGDVTVIPTQNPDQLGLFQGGDVDAVWTVEPWLSRLELDAGGKLYLEEPDSITTVLVSSAAMLKDRRDLAARFVRAHEELTAWIAANPEEAQRLVSAELQAETGSPVKPELMARCWPRLRFTNDVSLAALQAFVAAAQAAGFMQEAGDLSRLVERPE